VGPFVKKMESESSSSSATAPAAMHSSAKAAVCPRCDVEFPSTTKMTAHRLGCRLVCDACQEVCKSKAALAAHKKTTHETTAPRLECANCAETFSKPHQLAQHRLSAHEVGRPWSCDACDKSFGRQDLLRRHVTEVHSDAAAGSTQQPPTRKVEMHCPCGVVVRRRDNWERHVRRCPGTKPEEPPPPSFAAGPEQSEEQPAS